MFLFCVKIFQYCLLVLRVHIKFLVVPLSFSASFLFATSQIIYKSHSYKMRDMSVPICSAILDTYEQKSKYFKHRQRVKNAKSIVNSQAPVRKPKLDAQQKELSYLEMLMSLQKRARSKTTVRTFTKAPETIKARRRALTERVSPELVEPIEIPRNLNLISDSLPTSGRSSNRSKDYAIPTHVLKRYEKLNVPQDSYVIRKLLRPRVYFDLEVKHMRPLGRLVIQLYTEACPEVVLEFVRACSSQNQDRINFTRLFPPIWLEGELTLDDNRTLSMPGVEHDLDVIDHGSGPGILSFPSRYVRGSKRRFLNFTISFKPITVLNGKRIAFGRVRRGYWILDTIQDYGTKNGKPLKEIVVTKCGVLR